SAADYASLKQALSSTDGRESAAFLVCGVSSTPEHQRFLVREVLPVPESAYVERLSYHLEIAPRFINAVVDRCVGKGFGIVATHSHPGKGPAHYSMSDDEGEKRLFDVFSALLGPGKHASLLLTDDDITGRSLVGNHFVQLDG